MSQHTTTTTSNAYIVAKLFNQKLATATKFLLLGQNKHVLDNLVIKSTNFALDVTIVNETAYPDVHKSSLKIHHKSITVETFAKFDLSSYDFDSAVVVLSETWLHLDDQFMMELGEAIRLADAQLWFVGAFQPQHARVTWDDNDQSLGQYRFYDMFGVISESETEWAVPNRIVSGLCDGQVVHQWYKGSARVWASEPVDKNGCFVILRLRYTSDWAALRLHVMNLHSTRTAIFLREKGTSVCLEVENLTTARALQGESGDEILSFQVKKGNRGAITPEVVRYFTKKYRSACADPSLCKKTFLLMPLTFMLDLLPATYLFNPKTLIRWCIDNPKLIALVTAIIELLIAACLGPIGLIAHGTGSVLVIADAVLNTNPALQEAATPASDEVVSEPILLAPQEETTINDANAACEPEQEAEEEIAEGSFTPVLDQQIEAILEQCPQEEKNLLKKLKTFIIGLKDSVRTFFSAAYQRVHSFFRKHLILWATISLALNPVKPFVYPCNLLKALRDAWQYRNLRPKLVGFDVDPDNVHAVLWEELLPLVLSFFGPIGAAISCCYRLGNLVEELSEDKLSLRDRLIKTRFHLISTGITALVLVVTALVPGAVFLGPFAAIGQVIYHIIQNSHLYRREPTEQEILSVKNALGEHVVNTIEAADALRKGAKLVLTKIGDFFYALISYPQSLLSRAACYLFGGADPKKSLKPEVAKEEIKPKDAEDNPDVEGSGAWSRLFAKAKIKPTELIETTSLQVLAPQLDPKIEACFQTLVYKRPKTENEPEKTYKLKTWVLNYYARSGKSTFVRNLLKDVKAGVGVWAPNENLRTDWVDHGFSNCTYNGGLILVIDEFWACLDNKILSLSEKYKYILFIGDSHQIAHGPKVEDSFTEPADEPLKKELRQKIGHGLRVAKELGFSCDVHGYNAAFASQLFANFTDPQTAPFIPVEYKHNPSHRITHVVLERKADADKDTETRGFSKPTLDEEIFEGASLMVLSKRDEKVAKAFFPNQDWKSVGSMQGVSTGQVPRAVLFTASAWDTTKRAEDTDEKIRGVKANKYTFLTRYVRDVVLIAPPSWNMWKCSEESTPIAMNRDPYTSYANALKRVQFPKTNDKYQLLANALISHYYHRYNELPRKIIDVGCGSCRLGAALKEQLMRKGVRPSYFPHNKIVNSESPLKLDHVFDIAVCDITIKQNPEFAKVRDATIKTLIESSRLLLSKGWASKGMDFSGTYLWTSLVARTNSEYYIVVDDSIKVAVSFPSSFDDWGDAICEEGFACSDTAFGSSERENFWPVIKGAKRVSLKMPEFGFSSAHWNKLLKAEPVDMFEDNHTYFDVEKFKKDVASEQKKQRGERVNATSAAAQYLSERMGNVRDASLSYLNDLLKKAKPIHASTVPYLSYNPTALMPFVPPKKPISAENFAHCGLRGVDLVPGQPLNVLAYEQNAVNSENVARVRLLTRKNPHNAAALKNLQSFDIAQFYQDLNIPTRIARSDQKTVRERLRKFPSNRARAFKRALCRKRELFSDAPVRGHVMTKADEVLVQPKQYHDKDNKAARGLVNPDTRFLVEWLAIVASIEAHFRRHLNYNSRFFFASGAHSAVIADWLERSAHNPVTSNDFSSMDASYLKELLYLLIDIVLYLFKHRKNYRRKLRRALRRIIAVKLTNLQNKPWNPATMFNFESDGQLITGLNITLLFNSLCSIVLLYIAAMNSGDLHHIRCMAVGDDHVYVLPRHRLLHFGATYQQVIRALGFKATGVTTHWTETNFCSQVVYRTKPYTVTVKLALPTGDHFVTFHKHWILDWDPIRGQKAFHYSSSNPIPILEYVPQFLKSIANHKNVPLIRDLYKRVEKEYGVAEELTTYFKRKFPENEYTIQNCVYWELDEEWWKNQMLFRYGCNSESELMNNYMRMQFEVFPKYDSRVTMQGVVGLPAQKGQVGRQLKQRRPREKQRLLKDAEPRIKELEGFLKNCW